MPESELLLETLVQAVARMRVLQRQVWSPTEHPDLKEVLAAEREVDQLVALHQLPAVIPFKAKGQS